MDIIELSNKIDNLSNVELYELLKDGYEVFPKNLNIIYKLVIGKGYVLYPEYFEIVHTGDSVFVSDTFSSGGTGTFNYNEIISIETLEGKTGLSHRLGEIKCNTHTTGKQGTVGVTTYQQGNDPYIIKYPPKDGPIVTSLKKVFLFLKNNPIELPRESSKKTITEENQSNKSEKINQIKPSQIDYVSKLKELKELYDSEIISKEDYESKKSEYLKHL